MQNEINISLQFDNPEVVDAANAGVYFRMKTLECEQQDEIAYPREMDFYCGSLEELADYLEV